MLKILGEKEVTMANTTNEPEKTTQTVDSVDYGVDISYVAALFDSVDDAKKAYKALKELDREGFISIIDAAYVEKIGRSKIKVHDHNDWAIPGGIIGGGVGGAATGALIGLIGGVVLLPAAIGALLGGVLMGVYEYEDTRVSFTNKELKDLAEALPVGASTLVAIVEDDYVEAVEEEVKNQGGKKTHSGKIPKSTADSLAAKKTDKK